MSELRGTKILQMWKYFIKRIKVSFIESIEGKVEEIKISYQMNSQQYCIWSRKECTRSNTSLEIKMKNTKLWWSIRSHFLGRTKKGWKKEQESSYEVLQDSLMKERQLWKISGPYEGTTADIFVDKRS